MTDNIPDLIAEARWRSGSSRRCDRMPIMADRLIAVIEEKHCPLSTDGGGKPANHHVKDGACVICDMTPARLAHLHGIAGEVGR
jgi:hypothetical protein